MTAAKARAITKKHRQHEGLTVDEKLNVLDLGCAIEQTKQSAPLPAIYSDSTFGWGAAPNPWD
jgi:hypothetical protein